jgi:TonB family protein
MMANKEIRGEIAFFRSNCIVVVALIMASRLLITQDAAPSQQSSAATIFGGSTAFLSQAESYGIEVPGLGPWRLRVAFRLFDERGNPKDQGTYEELWVSETAYKRVFVSNLFVQTEYGTQNPILRIGNQNPPPSPLLLLRLLIAFPMISDSAIAGLTPAISNLIVETQQRDLNGIRAQCFDLRRIQELPVDTVPQWVSYCFDASDSLTTYSVGFPGAVQATLKNAIHFRGRVLPGDLVINRSGITVLTAHIESIEPLNVADEAELHPKSDTFSQHTRMVNETGSPAQSRAPAKIDISPDVAEDLIVTRVLPCYPPVARSRAVQGTVILLTTIGKDGSVEDLHVVSGPPMLQKAALDAVKRWKYKPYLLNGEPVEVLTKVNVVFALYK